MNITKAKQNTAFETLKSELKYTNVFQTPRLEKVVVSVGVGSAKDKNRLKLVEERLAKITGQKPASRGAKKSIASFKLRQGDIVGYQVTLRGARMFDFLEKVIHIALPRTRDFRGISTTAVDDMGNLTMGIKESNIFPETSDDDLKDVFGLAVTVVTSAKSKKDAELFLRHLGVPFKK
jgi:large subunit ribosomal protein L5